MAPRFWILMGIVVGAYCYLVGHLFQVQLVNGEYYLARAESQYGGGGDAIAERGVISFTDKKGDALPAVTNKMFPLIYAVPKVIEDPKDSARRLAPLLGVSVDELVKKFSKKGDAYELLVRKAPPQVTDAVQSLEIKGIYVTSVPERFYPFGGLASQVIGYVGPKSEGEGMAGRYGLEEFYDAVLSGAGSSTAAGQQKKSPSGKNLALTLDLNLQAESERALEGLIQKYEAKGGTVIIEEPSTGKILAMGSAPHFDPNKYGESDIASFLNPATQQIYEPGSIFKVITMASGIDAGKFTPETTYVDTGGLTINGRHIQNYDLKEKGPYGKITMTNVIEHSVNTGAVFAERLIGRELFRSYLEKFGIAERTGIGLPGEVKSDIRQLNPKARDIAYATASYGQGVAVTPLGLLTAISAIANHGIMMRPYVNAALAPQEIRRVIEEDAARKVTEMMVSAVDKAEVAKVSGYAVAGKTGTAFIPDFKKGGYTDHVVNTYVGFAPAYEPRFIILMKLVDPRGAPVAGLSVVPAFRELAQFVLNYYDVPPDRISR